MKALLVEDKRSSGSRSNPRPASSRPSGHVGPLPVPSSPRARAALRTRGDVAIESELRGVELRDAALRTVDRLSERITPAAADHVDELLRDSEVAGTVARSVIIRGNPDYESGFWKQMRFANAALTPAEGRAFDRYREAFPVTRAAAESGSFGVAVPVVIDSVIMPSSQDTGAIAAASHNVTTVSDVWKGVSSDGLTMTFPGEAGVRADATATLAQPSIPAYFASGYFSVSYELSDDFAAFQDSFGALVARGYQDLLSQKCAVGSGSGEPTGVFTALNSHSSNRTVVTTSGVFGGADLRKVWSQVPERARQSPGTVWFMHPNSLAMITAQGNNLSMADVVTDRQGVTIMSKKVITSAYCPDPTGVTTGAAQYVAVGDFSAAYHVVTHVGGLQVEMIPHAQRDPATQRPTMSRGFMAYARFGADLTPGLVRELTNT
jgi:HK97 family phage major capsid protein